MREKSGAAFCYPVGSDAAARNHIAGNHFQPYGNEPTVHRRRLRHLNATGYVREDVGVEDLRYGLVKHAKTALVASVIRLADG